MALPYIPQDPMTDKDLQRKIGLQILRLDSLISSMRTEKERKRQARKLEVASMLSDFNAPSALQTSVHHHSA